MDPTVDPDPLELFAPESAGSERPASTSRRSKGDDEVTLWAFEDSDTFRPLVIKPPGVDLLALREAVKETPPVPTPVTKRVRFQPKGFVRAASLGRFLAAGFVVAAIYLAWPRPTEERQTTTAPAAGAPQERRVAALLASRPSSQISRPMVPLPGADLVRVRPSLRSLSADNVRTATEPTRPGITTEPARGGPRPRSASLGQEGPVAAVDPTSVARPLLPSAPPPIPSQLSQLALVDASAGAAITNSSVAAVPADTGPTLRAPAVAPASSGPETSSTSSRENEMAAIQTVLGRYRNALSARNAGAAKEVWPTVDVKALGKALERLAEQRLEFGTCQIVVTDPRAVALCHGTAQYIPSIGNKSMRYESREWKFDLQKRDQSWVIAAVDSR